MRSLRSLSLSLSLPLSRYLPVCLSDGKCQAKSGWRGGLNLTTLALLERRAWGTYLLGCANSNDENDDKVSLPDHSSDSSIQTEINSPEHTVLNMQNRRME
jgi:hypothetical protein